MTGEPVPGSPGPSPPATTSALGRCIGIDSGSFAAQHWGRVPLLSRRAQLPGAFDDLLDLQAADELLSRRGLRTPFVRIVRDGEVLGSGQFTGSGGAGAEIADQVRDDRVAELFAGGATIVLQALHRNWPPVIDFVGRLAIELGHPVQANAYLTAPSSRGFAAHYDVHDVFVLQLAGRKHWTVHPPVHPDPLRDQPWQQHAAAVAHAAVQHEPVLDTVLEPGDALYLPRGYLHAATSLPAITAHLTVGVHTVTRFALVEALGALLAERAELRAALPMGLDVADPAQLAPHLRTVVDQLCAALREVPAADVARWVRQRVWAGCRPEPLGPIAQASFATAVRPEQVVRCRGGLRCVLRTGQDQLVLELPDRTITLPPGTRPALEALLGGGEVVVGRLPGLADADRLVLVRRLLREGVLVPATTT
ncbi:MAG TPA: cupin domain-containing protein [Pseudonocardiaceae bacterium]|nr:cupin domain-containing protein [Pseudonocardiaceae bacterium]